MFKKYMSVSFHVGSKKNAIPNLKKLKAIFIHNLRKYEKTNNPDLDLNLSQYNIILKGTKNLIEDVKKLYKVEFNEAVYNYNQKQNREERKITNYLTKVEEDKQKNICTELILQVGDKEDWQNINMEDKKKMAEVFKNSLNLLESKGFKVANATLHLDETSPHLHVVGVPVGTGFKKGLEKQVSSKSVFSIDKLDTLRDEIEKTIIEDFNKVYNVNAEKKQEKALLQEHLSVADFKELKPVLDELVKLTNKNIALEQVKQEIKKKDKQKLEQENELKAKNKELSNVTEEIREIENEINNQEDIKKELEEKKNTSNELKKKVLEQDFEIQKLKSEKNSNDILLDMQKQNIKRVAESIKEAKVEQEKKEKEKEEEQEKVKKVQQELEQVTKNREIAEYTLQESRDREKELKKKIDETQEKIENLENSYNIENEKLLELAKREKTYNVNGFKINSFSKEFVEEALEKKVEKVYIMANTEDFKIYYLNKNNDEVEMKNHIFYNGADKYYNTILSISDNTKFFYNFKTGETTLSTENEDIEFKKSGIFNLVRTLNSDDIEKVLKHNYNIAKGIEADDEEKVIEKNFTKTFADEEDEKEKDDFEIGL